jgi:hypothetical protein
VRRQLLGEEHPDTLTTSNNLALSLLGEGNYAEAERINPPGDVSCGRFAVALGSRTCCPLWHLGSQHALLRGLCFMGRAVSLARRDPGRRRPRDSRGRGPASESRMASRRAQPRACKAAAGRAPGARGRGPEPEGPESRQ